MAEELTPQEEWAAFLGGTHPHLQDKSPLRFIPSSPRCRLCSAPFGRPGAFVLRRYGYTPWEKNPKICGRCFKGIEAVAKMCPIAEEDGEEPQQVEQQGDHRGEIVARSRQTEPVGRPMKVLANDSTRVMVSVILGQSHVGAVMRRLVAVLRVEPLAGRLWVIDKTTVRIREGSD